METKCLPKLTQGVLQVIVFPEMGCHSKVEGTATEPLVRNPIIDHTGRVGQSGDDVHLNVRTTTGNDVPMHDVRIPFSWPSGSL